MGTVYLKRGDTKPILEVALKDPDGAAHDLTGETAWMHITLRGSSTVISREMTIQSPPTAGIARYSWTAADWAAGLEAGAHKVEFEALSGSDRMTFPNNGYDTLVVTGDLADG